MEGGRPGFTITEKSHEAIFSLKCAVSLEKVEVCRVGEAEELSAFLRLPPPHPSGPQVPHVTFQSWWVAGGGCPLPLKEAWKWTSVLVENPWTQVCVFFLPAWLWKKMKNEVLGGADCPPPRDV